MFEIFLAHLADPTDVCKTPHLILMWQKKNMAADG